MERERAKERRVIEEKAAGKSTWRKQINIGETHLTHLVLAVPPQPQYANKEKCAK